MRRPLVCFDIDGTLVRTRGAGREALDEAFAELWGWPDATAGVHVAGATDNVICLDVAAKFGRIWRADDTPPLRERYLVALAERLDDPARTEVLPGLPSILHEIGEVADLCLLTGNWLAGAERKLKNTCLEERFLFGAFAEDAPDRNGLVPVARARAKARGLAAESVVVVGDTVADVACARAGGATVIVVETGFSTPAALRDARPDLLVADLAAGRSAVLAFVKTLALG